MNVQEPSIISLIRESVRTEVNRIAAEESDAAAARVRQRVSDAIDGLALKLMDHYSIESRGRTITITVHKSVDPS